MYQPTWAAYFVIINLPCFVAVDSVVACFMITAFILSMVVANMAVIGMLLAFLEAILVELEEQLSDKDVLTHYPQQPSKNIAKRSTCGNADHRQGQQAAVSDQCLLVK